MARPFVFASGSGIGSHFAGFEFLGSGLLSFLPRFHGSDRGGRHDPIEIRPSLGATPHAPSGPGGFQLTLADSHMVKDTSSSSVSLCPGCATCAQAASAGKGFDGYEVAAATNPGGGSTTHDEGVLNVTVGGTVSAVIDTIGDTDTITVSLVAGQTYSIYLYGSGGSPVADTYITVSNPSAVVVAQDDDGGVGLYSLVTITAAVTGTYTITAAAFDNGPDFPGTGGYTVAVHQQGSDSVPNTVSAAMSSPVAASVGLNYGFIETSGDNDVYAVTLTAGMLYSFEVAGGADYNTNYQAVPLGELDTRIRIYDSAGTLLYSNDDIDFPDDISSALSFLPDASGTYYIEIDPYSTQTGGYVLEITETDPADLDILDTINWGGNDNVVDNSDTLLIYFATAGQTFDGVTSLGWSAYEQEQALEAFQTYSQFANLQFAITTNQAEADFTLVTTTSTEYLGYFNPPGETNAGVGVFAVNGDGWDDEGGLEPGGYGWITLVHEFGHALGMAHPHDTGGGSQVLTGVTGPFDSYGLFDLNQGIYTTMSYNDGWQLHPDAVSGFPPGVPTTWGYQGTPMALDIALMQIKYGAVDHNTGDTVYTLPTANAAGTYWQAIWDTGGNDTIQHTGTVSAQIDLMAATLDYTATGGGVISWVDGVFGGFTIAAGVVIENASGGSGADTLLGNSAANNLYGNDGADTLMGRGGNDNLYGGEASDTAVFSGNFADYTITHVGGTVWTVTDNNLADGDDGTDTLYDIEFAQFADTTFDLDEGAVVPNVEPAGAEGSATVAQDGSYVFTEGDFGFSDTDGDDFAGVVITTLPANGTLLLNGVAITVAGTFVSASDIDGGLLVFEPDAGEFGEGYASFTFQVRDTGGTAGGGVDTDQTPNTFEIDVTPPAGNTGPSLTGLVAEVTFLENTVNATPQIIDADVTFTDPDNNFDGGTVVVSGLLAEDVVGVNNQGTGAGQIGVSGANVTYGGVVIGTIAGGNGATLTITLNAAATSAAVDALLQNLTYANTSDTPTGTRTLTINVTDDEGADLGGPDIYTPGPFVEATGANDPLANPSILPTFAGAPALAFVDVNGDGDLDIVVGDQPGTLRYFENNGAGGYTEVTGGASPFSGFVGQFPVGSEYGSLYTSPATIDIDGDGDLDLVVGNNYGYFATIQNNGNGTWTQLTGGANPFGNLYHPYFSDVAGIDFDGDGDMDLVSGNNAGGLAIVENLGGGVWEPLASGSPFPADIGSFASPTAGDIDGDGDDDLVVGNSTGTLLTFINNGDGTFTQLTGSNNPFNGIDVGSYSVPSLVDIDGDGDADLVVADSAGGDTRVWINTGTFAPGTPPPQVVVNVTPQSEPPVLADVSAITVYTDDAAPVVLSGSLDIDDPDDTNIEGAVVTITNAQTGDQLTIGGDTSGTVGSISFSYSAGVLTLTGTGTIAEYEAVLQQVAFGTTSPSTVDREITWTVSDGESSSVAAETTVEFASSPPTNIFALVDDATVTLGGDGQIYATDGEQTVTILDDSYFIFRSGFNSGAQDTINLSGLAENFEASVLSVSNILLTSVEDNITVIISVGENGTWITFEGGDTRLLSIDGDTGVMTLGSETIDSSADPLAPAVAPKIAPPEMASADDGKISGFVGGFHGSSGEVKGADYLADHLDYRPMHDILLTSDIYA